MHEEKFVLMEGETMTLTEIASELEHITGYTALDTFGDIERVVAQKPNFEQDFETYIINYQFNESEDEVDVTVTTRKDGRQHLKKDKVKIRLISYKTRS